MATWERAMLAWPNGDRCERSRETLETARRLMRWPDAAEGCSNCRKRAVAVCGREAFCGTCEGQRAARVLEKRRGTIAPASGNAGAVGTGTEGGGTLRGHAIVFGAPSLDLGGFVEIIRPSAVDRTISEKTDLRALWNHDSSLPIGRVSAGTLVIRKDARGLRVRIAAPSSARAYVESVERRDVSGMSFAFRALDDAWRLEDGMPIREVTDMAMSEVSAVTFPVYPATSVSTGAEGAGRSVDFARRQLRVLLAR